MSTAHYVWKRKTDGKIGECEKKKGHTSPLRRALGAFFSVCGLKWSQSTISRKVCLYNSVPSVCLWLLVRYPTNAHTDTHWGSPRSYYMLPMCPEMCFFLLSHITQSYLMLHTNIRTDWWLNVSDMLQRHARIRMQNRFNGIFMMLSSNYRMRCI